MPIVGPNTLLVREKVEGVISNSLTSAVVELKEDKLLVSGVKKESSDEFSLETRFEFKINMAELIEIIGGIVR